MVRVEVKNFQSMVSQVIEIDGFSTVVGRSNIGKSAIVRAIKSALTGAPADTCVRHGEDCLRRTKGSKTCKCFCSVRLVGPGVDLLWEKGDSINRYVYNSVEYTVPGRGTPEFLGDAFAMISVGDKDKSLLQVSDQFDPLFILNKSGTVVADVLSDVAKLDQINAASRLVERDRKESTSTRKVRDRDRDELHKALTSYDGLDAALSLAAQAEQRVKELGKLEAQDEVLTRYTNSLVALLTARKELDPVQSLEVPTVKGLDDRQATLSYLGKVDRVQTVAEESIARISSVVNVAVPEMAVTRELDSYLKLIRLTDRAVSLKSFFEASKVAQAALVPEVTGAVSASSTLVRLNAWVSGHDRVSKALSDLESMVAAAEIEEAKALASVRALGVCPTCKKPLTVEHQEAAHA